MKTTVEIADPLFRAARAHCAERGISFRELVETGIRHSLEQRASAVAFRLKPFGFAGAGQQVNDWPTIRELLYEGHGGTPETGSGQ